MKTSADFTEQQVRFAAHARVATRAAEAGPEQPANRYGCAASAFTRERADKTLRKLSRPGSGVSKRDLKELERVADAVSNGRSDVRRLAEYTGERGGEQMLNREGHHIPEAFHSVQPPPHAAPARATWTAWPSHPAGTRSSSPSTRAAPPPTTRARPTLLMSSMSSEPRPRPRARPTMSWTACWRTSASPGTSTTTPACGSSSRTAVPACARTSSRPPARGGPPGSAPRASRPHPASLPSSSRRSPVSKHSTTHQTPKRKDHPMTDFFVLQVREDVA